MGKIKNVPFRVFCYVLVFLFLFIYLFPLFFVANTSLKSAQDYLLHPTALTSTWSFGNYITAWNKANFGAYIGNSILYTGVCTICSLLLSLLIAFPISRKYVPGAGFLYLLFLCGLFLPNGMILKNTLLDYWRQVHKKYGYVEISTPIMLNRQLWERSGHWDHYKNNMYTTVIDDVDFAVKPMNCPGGMLVYASQPHSYKELPLRVGEIGLVHRHELSGALHGLFRVRCFNQDDAHVFMTRDQMQDVIQETVRLFDEVYSVFGLSYTIELSTMPEDHIGTVEEWERNQDILKNAITAMGKDFVINEGDGAFYGPKLDFHLADSLGRTWQCGTIQLDSQLPERFELEYTGEDGQKHRPVMIHRVVLGSIERFIGVITEHFAGAFPAWLAPVQVKVLPVTDRAAQYADQISKDLDEAGFRVEVDHRNEKIGKKIREATMEKVPYMLVVGDRDMEGQTVSVRMRSGEDLGAMSCVQFQALLAEDVRTKAIK